MLNEETCVTKVPTSIDSLFEHQLVLEQPLSGYRFNVDSVHLAKFIGKTFWGNPKPMARYTLDLGSGVGALGLSLLHLNLTQELHCIEVDKFAASLAKKNAAENGFQDRTKVYCTPIETMCLSPIYDLVASNPPYLRPKSGRPSPNPQKEKARTGDLQVFLKAARAYLTKRGRFMCCYPSSNIHYLLQSLAERGLYVKRMQLVHPSPTKPARLVMIEAKAAKPGGLVIEPPLFEETSSFA